MSACHYDTSSFVECYISVCSYVFVLVIRITTQKMCVAFFQSAVYGERFCFFLYLILAVSSLCVKPNMSLWLAKFVRFNRPKTLLNAYIPLQFAFIEGIRQFFNQLECHEKLLNISNSSISIKKKKTITDQIDWFFFSSVRSCFIAPIHRWPLLAQHWLRMVCSNAHIFVLSNAQLEFNWSNAVFNGAKFERNLCVVFYPSYIRTKCALNPHNTSGVNTFWIHIAGKPI